MNCLYLKIFTVLPLLHRSEVTIRIPVIVRGVVHSYVDKVGKTYNRLFFLKFVNSCHNGGHSVELFFVWSRSIRLYFYFFIRIRRNRVQRPRLLFWRVFIRACIHIFAPSTITAFCFCVKVNRWLTDSWFRLTRIGWVGSCWRWFLIDFCPRILLMDTSNWLLNLSGAGSLFYFGTIATVCRIWLLTVPGIDFILFIAIGLSGRMRRVHLVVY